MASSQGDKSGRACVPCAGYPSSLLHWPCGSPLWLIFRIVIVDWRGLVVDVLDIFEVSRSDLGWIGLRNIYIRGGGGSVHCVAHGGSITDWGGAG